MGDMAAGVEGIPSSLADLAERERQRRRAALRVQREGAEAPPPRAGGAGVSEGREQNGGGRGAWAQRRPGIPEHLRPMRPEWMAVPPGELSSDWLVAARPEGRRCVVLSRGGHTVARDPLSGATLVSTSSSLPGGGGARENGKGQQCALDCVLEGGEGGAKKCAEGRKLKFWVLDVLFWGDLEMLQCEAEMRVCWTASQVLEADPEGDLFAPVRFAPAEGGNILEAYRGEELEYVRDGLLFLHREGHYLGGRGAASFSSPLALLWKDEHCSRFPINTDGAGVVPALQRVVLRVVTAPDDGDDALAGTSDEPAVFVARVPASECGELRQGTLLNFFLEPAELAGEKRPRLDENELARGGEVCGRVLGQNVVFESRAGPRRMEADAFSKIAFQQRLRSGDPLTIQNLLQASMG